MIPLACLLIAEFSVDRFLLKKMMASNSSSCYKKQRPQKMLEMFSVVSRVRKFSKIFLSVKIGCLISVYTRYALVYYHVRYNLVSWRSGDTSCTDVFAQKALQQIFIARDPLGRRSLLVHMPNEKNPRFLLSSVSIGVHSLYNFEELSTTSIFYVDVDELSNTGVSYLFLGPYYV